MQHLQPLRTKTKLTLLSKNNLPGGTDTELWFQDTIKSTQLVLFLLSADYLTDQDTLRDYSIIIEQSKIGQLKAIPVLVRPCDWQAISEMKTIVPLPKGGRALSTLSRSEREMALVEIARALALIVDELTRNPNQKVDNTSSAYPSPQEKLDGKLDKPNGTSALASPKKLHLIRWGLLGLPILAGLIYLSWRLDNPFRPSTTTDLWCTECDQKNAAGDRCGCDPRERLFRDTVCRLDVRSELQECRALVGEIANSTTKSAQLSECIRGKVTTNPLIARQIERGPSEESILFYRRKCLDIQELASHLDISEYENKIISVMSKATQQPEYFLVHDGKRRRIYGPAIIKYFFYDLKPIIPVSEKLAYELSAGEEIDYKNGMFVKENAANCKGACANYIVIGNELWHLASPQALEHYGCKGLTPVELETADLTGRFGLRNAGNLIGGEHKNIRCLKATSGRSLPQETGNSPSSIKVVPIKNSTTHWVPPIESSMSSTPVLSTKKATPPNVLSDSQLNYGSSPGPPTTKEIPPNPPTPIIEQYIYTEYDRPWGSYSERGGGRIGPQARKQVTWNLELNTDRNSTDADYKDFVPRESSPQLCAKACQEDEQCLAFTFVHPGYQGEVPRCYLKKTIPPASPHPCCVSGVKPREAPSAAWRSTR